MEKFLLYLFGMIECDIDYRIYASTDMLLFAFIYLGDFKIKNPPAMLEAGAAESNEI